ncbi:3-hydroxy acid dehydrogenase YdfG [uncultured Gammaproteobacteria bacterium]
MSESPASPPAHLPATVLVTGASSGFGAAIARRFAALGSRLIITGRRRERLEALAIELGVPCLVLAFDIRDRAATQAALTTLPAEFAAIDLLVNNAGLALGLGPAHRTDLDDWEAMIATNVQGLATCTRLLLPGMVERNRGHVVNIGSIAGNWPYPGGSVYCASKAFVKQFSLALRADLLGTRVRVTNIEPGMAETEFSLVRFHGDSARADQVYVGTQALTAGDVAEAVVWCATLPEHCNINRIELMPTAQSFKGLAVHRDKEAL